MQFIDEFLEFLENYEIIGLAIAFVIGVTVKDLVNATVDDLIMPVIGVFLPEGGWESATWTLFSIEFQVGHFFSVLIEFLIIALLIFLFVKYALGKDEVEKI